MRHSLRPGLLVLVAATVLPLLPASYASDGRRSLDLPEIPFAYAGPALPNHFDRRTLRRLDNAPRRNRMTDEAAMLGRVLFYDTRLSANERMSCSTCHVQKHAFADPRRFSKGVHGHRGRRNSMSIVNLRYQGDRGFFWDERASTLEEQALMPIEDPKEMAFDVDELVERLSLDPTYAVLFQYAFRDPVITRDGIAKALAQFVRAIVSYRSKFDEGMRLADSVEEDFPNFSARENEGKRIFFGLEDTGRGPSCAACHVPRAGPGRGPGGSAANRGKVAFFQGRGSGNNGLDDEIGKDAGVGEHTGQEADRGLFKIPTLRNIELTAPYMHDGRFRTLKQVVEHYRRGVQPHPNLDGRLGGGGPRAGRRGPRGVQLTVRQRDALIAFLETLTDHELVEDPRFSNPWR